MATLKYRDPTDGVFKDLAGPAGAPGPTGPAGPAPGEPNASMPVGAIMPYVGIVAPTGWHLCDGTAHGSSALQAVTGSANTPDLRDRFPKVAGPTHALGATGGAATVTLTAAQTGTVGHTHTGTVASHTHTVDLANTTSGAMSANASHSHPAASSTKFALLFATGNEKRDGTGSTHKTISAWNANTGLNTAPTSLAHTHALDIAAFNSAGASGAAAITAVAAANATAAHENLPSYRALNFIIKVA